MELEHEGEVIVLAVPDAVLGRTSACEIQISHPLVSRKHCRLEASAEGVWLEDLGSSNGTYLNGERIAERRTIRPGDVFRIGQEGPQFVLLLATVDGRDIGASQDGEDEATMIAGDPALAALRARVRVSPDAAPPAAEDDEDDEDTPTAEARTPAPEPQTTGAIPVATPIGPGDESMLGGTDIWEVPLREPATRAVQRAGDATRPAAPPPAAEPPEDPNDGTRPAAVPRTPPVEDPNDRTRPAAVPRAAPPAEPVQPAPDATPSATVATPTARRERRGGGVLAGFVIGLLVVLALGVLTPLGRALHALAPWSDAPAEAGR